jgi:feruloyl-CoA synthase
VIPAPGKLDPAGLREHLSAGLRRYNATYPGASTTVRRALVLDEPPSIDGGEITDKGYINQRAVLSRRAPLVERLLAIAPDDSVIMVEANPSN